MLGWKTRFMDFDRCGWREVRSEKRDMESPSERYEGM